VAPCAVVIKLVDRGGATEGDTNREDDVLLFVERALVARERAFEH
jgi:hypothetical protein